MAQNVMSFSTVLGNNPGLSTDNSISHYGDVLAMVLKSFGPELIFVAVTFTIAISMRASHRRGLGSMNLRKKTMPKFVPTTRSPGRSDAGQTSVAPWKRSSSPQQAAAHAPMSLAEVVDQAIGIRLSTAKTLAYYEEMRASGKHVSLEQDLQAAGSKHTASDFFAALVQCAGRAGRPQLVEQLLDDMAEVGVPRTVAIYESSMRLLAGKKYFREALSVYDRMDKDGRKPSSTTLSCLVGFASELGELDRAINFFNLLEQREVPSVRACMCVLRVYSKKKDWNASAELLRRITDRGVQVDSIMFNITLATGISAREVDAALQLLNEEPGQSVADIVSYNIILKGLAQLGKVDRAILLLQTIVEQGVQPNLISFNTAMDAAVRAHKSDDAWRLYNLMIKETALKPDKCTCSTLVKGLYQHHNETLERVACILNIIDACIDECSTELRGSLLSGALEAACRLPNVQLAMRAFVKMQEQEIIVKATELRNLARTTAKVGDIESCKMVWLRIAMNPGELETEKAEFDKLVRAGLSIDVATLQCLTVN